MINNLTLPRGSRKNKIRCIHRGLSLSIDKSCVESLMTVNGVVDESNSILWYRKHDNAYKDHT